MTSSGKTVPLRDLAKVVRSKNAGPFRLTLDVMFEDRKTYEKVKRTGVFTPELVARLYRMTVDKVTDFVEYDAGMAFKATLVRPAPSGSVGDTDIYGAQQHGPLLDVQIPWE